MFALAPALRVALLGDRPGLVYGAGDLVAGYRMGVCRVPSPGLLCRDCRNRAGSAPPLSCLPLRLVLSAYWLAWTFFVAIAALVSVAALVLLFV